MSNLITINNEPVEIVPTVPADSRFDTIKVKIGPHKVITTSGVLVDGTYRVMQETLSSITKYMNPSELYGTIVSLPEVFYRIEPNQDEDVIQIYADVRSYLYRYVSAWQFVPETQDAPSTVTWKGLQSVSDSATLALMGPMFTSFNVLFGRYLANPDRNVSLVARSFRAPSQVEYPSLLRATWIAHITILSFFKGLTSDNTVQVQEFLRRRFNTFRSSTGYASTQPEIKGEDLIRISDLGKFMPNFRRAIIEALGDDESNEIAQATLGLLSYTGMTTYNMIKIFLDQGCTYAHVLPAIVKESIRFRSLVEEIESHDTTNLERMNLAILRPDVFTFKQNDYPNLSYASTEYAKLRLGDRYQNYTIRTRGDIDSRMIMESLKKEIVRPQNSTYTDIEVEYLRSQGLYDATTQEVRQESRSDILARLLEQISRQI